MNQERIEKALDLLQEIAEGKGPYSHDPLTHCENCLENMKKLAEEALELLML